MFTRAFCHFHPLRAHHSAITSPLLRPYFSMCKLYHDYVTRVLMKDVLLADSSAFTRNPLDFRIFTHQWCYEHNWVQIQAWVTVEQIECSLSDTQTPNKVFPKMQENWRKHNMFKRMQTNQSRTLLWYFNCNPKCIHFVSGKINCIYKMKILFSTNDFSEFDRRKCLKNKREN